MAAIAFLCGVPKEACTGGLHTANVGLYKSIKAHASRREAMHCYIRYLLGTGYRQLSAREFQPIQGGEVLVIPKVSKFGGELKRGKTGEEGGKQSKKRVMPEINHAGMII